MKDSFNYKRKIETAGWSIHPFGSYYGYLLGSVDEALLNVLDASDENCDFYVEAGIEVVTASGNANTDACRRPPGPEEASLAPHDIVAISCWIISIAMIA